MKKRMVLFLLALVMALGVIPAMAMTANASDADTYVYTNYDWGKTENDIIKSVTYVMDENYAYTATVTIDISHVDQQQRDYGVEGIGYCWYREDNQMHYGTLGGYSSDQTEYTFQVATDLFPGEDWTVRVYLAEDYYADYELSGYSFNSWLMSVPGVKFVAVEANALGIDYDEVQGIWVPLFDEITLYDTGYNKLYEDDVFTITPLYTEDTLDSSSKLTEEPEIGTTYYGAIRIMLANAGLTYDLEDCQISVNGYKVEVYDILEREMGGFLEIRYSLSIPCVWVGGVQLKEGEYLPTGSTQPQTTQPEGGFAFFTDGYLVLYDYRYTGKGYEYNPEEGYSSIILSEGDLSIRLEGANVLTQVDSNSEHIWCQGSVDVAGSGSLQTIGGYGGIFVDDSLIISSGDIFASGGVIGLFTYNGDIVIEGGNISLVAEEYGMASSSDIFIKGGNVDVAGGMCGLVALNDIDISGGNVTAKSIDQSVEGCAIHAGGSLTISDHMRVRAAVDADGTPGEYVADNLLDYNLMVINEPGVIVGGVGLLDGECLAVGATVSQATKPSGGYAYYKDGTLTLNNYSYNGQGYAYNDSYSAIIYSKKELKVYLEGTNSLTQTHGASDHIYCLENLTLEGPGSLQTEGGYYGIFSRSGDVTVNSGTYNIYNAEMCIRTGGKAININGGTLDCQGVYGLRADGYLTINGGTVVAVGYCYGLEGYHVYINGGNVTAVCPNGDDDEGSWAILAVDDIFVVADNLKVQASTDSEGALGAYVEDNLTTYDRIVIGAALPAGPTLVKIDGVWRYVENGQLSDATTLVKYNGSWWYVKNGVLNTSNTLCKYNGKWYHVNGGKWVKDTTLVKYGGVWHYVKDGIKNTANTLCKFNGKWYHVNGGVWVKDTTLVSYGGYLHYVKGGIKCSETTLVKYNNEWYCVKNGTVDTSNTLFKFNGKWYHVNGGKWVKDTTLVSYGGYLHYVKDGIKCSETTLVKYNNEWYYVKNGTVDTSNTLFKFNGKWYHVNGGKWVKDTTLVKYNGSWYYVQGGLLNTSNTLCKYNGKWFHVNGGKWVKDTTLVAYGGKWFYVSGGIVDFTYNGTVVYNGKTYTVRNGIKV